MRFMKITLNIEWLLFIFAILLATAVAVSNQIVANDTITRYAPMAEAFARGDWQYAFHPRFGVVFSSISGTFVWLFNVNGVIACKMLAILFFGLSVFPLYRLFCLLWDNSTAKIGVVLYVLCSHLLRYSADGLRDNGKTLAVALIALALVSLYRDKSRIGAGVCLIVGMALLTLLRGEGALIALVCGGFGVYLVRDWRKIILGIGLFVFLLSPQLYYNFVTIGYAVPELRHGVLLDKIGIEPYKASVEIPESAR